MYLHLRNRVFVSVPQELFFSGGHTQTCCFISKSQRNPHHTVHMSPPLLSMHSFRENSQNTRCSNGIVICSSCHRTQLWTYLWYCNCPYHFSPAHLRSLPSMEWYPHPWVRVSMKFDEGPYKNTNGEIFIGVYLPLILLGLLMRGQQYSRCLACCY